MTDEAPQFTGITRYRDPRGRFSFHYPWDWRAELLDEQREGVMLRPDAADEDTYVAAWVSTLPTDVTVDDLPELRSGFDSGLATLPNHSVLKADEETVGGAVKLERTVTFRDGSQVRQRSIRALYAGQNQLIFVYQGATQKSFAYWLPMGNYCWATLQIAEEIWFGTDPDVSRAAQRAAEFSRMNQSIRLSEGLPSTRAR